MMAQQLEVKIAKVSGSLENGVALVTVAAAGENDRKIAVLVRRAVAHAAAKHHRSRIQQRLVAVLDARQPGQELVVLAVAS